MIGGISAVALRGLQVQQARFEQAASRMIATTAEGASLDAASVGGGVTDMVGATVEMATAQYALMASLRAAQTSNQMIGELLAGY